MCETRILSSPEEGIWEAR